MEIKNLQKIARFSAKKYNEKIARFSAKIYIEKQSFRKAFFSRFTILDLSTIYLILSKSTSVRPTILKFQKSFFRLQKLSDSSYNRDFCVSKLGQKKKSQNKKWPIFVKQKFIAS